MKHTTGSLFIAIVLAGCCSQQTQSAWPSIHIERGPAEYTAAQLLRGPAREGQVPVLVADGLSVVSGELIAAGQLPVRCMDGRMWLGLPAGDVVPYLDREGRLHLVPRETVFDSPERADLADVTARVSLDEVLADEARFRDFHP